MGPWWNYYKTLANQHKLLLAQFPSSTNSGSLYKPKPLLHLGWFATRSWIVEIIYLTTKKASCLGESNLETNGLKSSLRGLGNEVKTPCLRAQLTWQLDLRIHSRIHRAMTTQYFFMRGCSHCARFLATCCLMWTTLMNERLFTLCMLFGHLLPNVNNSHEWEVVRIVHAFFATCCLMWTTLMNRKGIKLICISNHMEWLHLPL